MRPIAIAALLTTLAMPGLATAGDDSLVVLDVPVMYAALNAVPVSPGAVVYSSSNRIHIYTPRGGGFVGRPEARILPGSPCNPTDWAGEPFDSDYVRGCARVAWSQAKLLSETAPDSLSCFSYFSNVRSIDCGSTAVDVCDVTVRQFVRSSTSYTAGFIVQSIRYALPGNKSKITYTDASSRGSQWETNSVTTNTFELKLDPKSAISGGVTRQVKQTGTRKLSISDTSTWIETVGSPRDAADHMRDEFVIWMNPTMTRYANCQGQTGNEVTAGAFPGRADYWVYYLPDFIYPDVYVYSSEYKPWVLPGLDPSTPQYETFTVAELLNPGSASTPEKQLFLSRLTAQEIYDNILRLDPFINPDGTIDTTPNLSPDRFRFVQSTASGCPPAFSGISTSLSAECAAKYSYQDDDTSTYNSSWSVSVSLGLAPAPSLAGTLKIDYTRSDTQTSAATNTAVVHLETSTPGVCIDGQLRVDTMFNTYVVPSYVHSCP